MSSTDLEIDYELPFDTPYDWKLYLKSELWIMNANGTGKQRLTFYNGPDVDHPHFSGYRTAVSDSAWAPDGQSLIVLVAHADGTGEDSSTNSSFTELVLITLGEENVQPNAK